MRFILLTLALFAAMPPCAADEGEMQRISGVVTLDTGMGYIFMHTPEGVPWRIDLKCRDQEIRRGDLVEVNGWLEDPLVRHTHRLFRCEVTRKGHDEAQLPEPRRYTIPQLREHPADRLLPDPDWYGDLVVIAGRVIDAFRREGLITLLLEDGAETVQVKITEDLRVSYPEHFGIGAGVEITGIAIYSAVRDSQRTLRGFDNPTILASGLDSLKVLSHPPFWTSARLVALAGVLVAILLGFALWTILLRRAVGKALARLEETMREKVQERIAAEAARRERLRMAHDLHDEFQQLLASTSFRLLAAKNLLKNGGGAAAVGEQLALAADSVTHTQAGLRTVLWSMTEESEGPNSLAGLVQYAAARMAHWDGIVSFEFHGRERPVSRQFAGTLLMILQEAVGNAIKHGGADHVRVTMTFTDEALEMAVADDGCGFEQINFGAGHLGICSMRARAVRLGGEFEITGSLGKGAVVKVRLPL
ncbi:MAG: ATP-binding protein [Kiritimatiellia bacterium]